MSTEPSQDFATIPSRRVTAARGTLIDHGTRTGYFFGTTSGVITTAGLMTGLYAGTDSLVAVLGGIFVIAVADALSDALGIHLAQESDAASTTRSIWLATFSTFAAKLVVSASFAVPLLLLPLDTGVRVALAWGLLILVLLSIQLARIQRTPVLPVVLEHAVIGVAVIAISHGVGVWVRHAFA
jgi:VIT1/CCC1 family predicted Fe2+/Mn2+ transporter